MNKEFLLEKIKSLTDCTSNEREAAFQFLIKNILKKIQNDQAIKIEGLGIFQLKKEPLLREERKDFANKNIHNRTLIYAPIYDENINLNNLFVSIDIENADLKESNEIDKVFSLGFGKPTIPLAGQDSSSFLKKIKDYRIKKTFEEIIAELVENAEVIDDFNIFTDYIEKSFQSNLDETSDETIKELIEQPENIETLESKGDESEMGIDEIVLPEGSSENSNLPEEKLEVELTDESIEKLFSDEELGKVFIKEPGETENPTENGSENIPEEIIEQEPNLESLEISDEKVEFVEDDVESDEKTDAKRKTMFDKLDEILTKPESEEILEEISEQNESEKSLSEVVADSNIIHDAVENRKKKNPIYTSFIFWFATIFIIVLAVVSYFLIPDYFSTESKVKKNEVNVSKIPEKKSEDLKIDTLKKNDEAIINEPTDNQTVNNEKESSLYRTPAQDKKITSQIYFDGTNYTVQVSSWLNKTIAENEVMKLRAKGFDAFIYQVFVPTKGSTWSRVRIGNFKSANEAEKFLINNQLKEK